jgi:hypothetical protein
MHGSIVLYFLVNLKEKDSFDKNVLFKKVHY